MSVTSTPTEIECRGAENQRGSLEANEEYRSPPSNGSGTSPLRALSCREFVHASGSLPGQDMRGADEPQELWYLNNDPSSAFTNGFLGTEPTSVHGTTAEKRQSAGKRDDSVLAQAPAQPDSPFEEEELEGNKKLRTVPEDQSSNGVATELSKGDDAPLARPTSDGPDRAVVLSSSQLSSSFDVASGKRRAAAKSKVVAWSGNSSQLAASGDSGSAPTVFADPMSTNGACSDITAEASKKVEVCPPAEERITSSSSSSAASSTLTISPAAELASINLMPYERDEELPVKNAVERLKSALPALPAGISWDANAGKRGGWRVDPVMKPRVFEIQDLGGIPKTLELAKSYLEHVKRQQHVFEPAMAAAEASPDSGAAQPTGGWYPSSDARNDVGTALAPADTPLPNFSELFSNPQDSIYRDIVAQCTRIITAFCGSMQYEPASFVLDLATLAVHPDAAWQLVDVPSPVLSPPLPVAGIGPSPPARVPGYKAPPPLPNRVTAGPTILGTPTPPGKPRGTVTPTLKLPPKPNLFPDELEEPLQYRCDTPESGSLSEDEAVEPIIPSRVVGQDVEASAPFRGRAAHRDRRDRVWWGSTSPRRSPREEHPPTKHRRSKKRSQGRDVPDAEVIGSAPAPAVESEEEGEIEEGELSDATRPTAAANGWSRKPTRRKRGSSTEPQGKFVKGDFRGRRRRARSGDHYRSDVERRRGDAVSSSEEETPMTHPAPVPPVVGVPGARIGNPAPPLTRPPSAAVTAGVTAPPSQHLVPPPFLQGKHATITEPPAKRMRMATSETRGELLRGVARGASIGGSAVPSPENTEEALTDESEEEGESLSPSPTSEAESRTIEHEKPLLVPGMTLAATALEHPPMGVEHHHLPHGPHMEGHLVDNVVPPPAASPASFYHYLPHQSLPLRGPHHHPVGVYAMQPPQQMPLPPAGMKLIPHQPVIPFGMLLPQQQVPRGPPMSGPVMSPPLLPTGISPPVVPQADSMHGVPPLQLAPVPGGVEFCPQPLQPPMQRPRESAPPAIPNDLEGLSDSSEDEVVGSPSQWAGESKDAGAGNKMSQVRAGSMIGTRGTEGGHRQRKRSSLRASPSPSMGPDRSMPPQAPSTTDAAAMGGEMPVMAMHPGRLPQPYDASPMGVTAEAGGGSLPGMAMGPRGGAEAGGHLLSARSEGSGYDQQQLLMPGTPHGPPRSSQLSPHMQPATFPPQSMPHVMSHQALGSSRPQAHGPPMAYPLGMGSHVASVYQSNVASVVPPHMAPVYGQPGSYSPACEPRTYSAADVTGGKPVSFVNPQAFMSIAMGHSDRPSNAPKHVSMYTQPHPDAQWPYPNRPTGDPEMGIAETPEEHLAFWTSQQEKQEQPKARGSTGNPNTARQNVSSRARLQRFLENKNNGDGAVDDSGG